MPCDPNTLIAEARCLEACIPQQMLQAVQVSLLCQIVDAGGGGGGGGGVESFNARTGAVTLTLGDVSAVADAQYVLKAGDTMTGGLTVEVATDAMLLRLNSSNSNSLSYENGTFAIIDFDGNQLLSVQGNQSEIGFFDGGTTQRTSGANLTNNVTAGGTDNTIDNFTSLTVYATDAAAIRNDIYQLARKLKQINDGLRAYGLFT